MLIGFGALGLILWCWPLVRNGVQDGNWSRAALGWDGSARQILALVFVSGGVCLFAVSRLAHAATRSIYVTWMSVTVPIGIVMSTVLLTVLYFVLLPPFALLMRWSDPMRRRLSDSDSYWEDHARQEPSVERMMRQF